MNEKLKQEIATFTVLVKDQFVYGGKKYALGKKRESTDLLFDDFGANWLYGTIAKYCFRFQNLQRERDLLKIACYSEDTEILTEKGWMLLKDVVEKKIKIKVATLNPEKNIVEYHYPTNYIKRYESGKLFRQKNKYFDLIVTLDHNLYVRYPSEDKYNFVEAKNVKKNCYYRRDFPYYRPKGLTYFVLPAYKSISYERSFKVTRRKPKLKILMDDWLKFFGIWLAEGYAGHTENNRSIVYISQYKSINSEKYKKIKEMLDKLPFKYTMSKNNKGFAIFDLQLWEYLKQFGKAKDKFIPRYLLNNLSNKQCKILLEWLIMGDGFQRGKESYVYTTSSKQLAEDVAELALKAGFQAHIIYSSSFKHSCHTVSISNFSKEVIVNSKEDLREEVNYKGYVYCVEVPNHIIYVRRKGKPVWCGNCYSYILWLKRGFFIDDRREVPIDTNIKIKEAFFEEFINKAKEFIWDNFLYWNNSCYCLVRRKF